MMTLSSIKISKLKKFRISYRNFTQQKRQQQLLIKTFNGQPIKKLKYIPRQEFFSSYELDDPKKISVKQPSSVLDLQDTTITNFGNSPRYALESRLIDKNAFKSHPLTQNDTLEFLFLVAPVEQILESIFSRNFYKKKVSKLAKNGLLDFGKNFGDYNKTGSSDFNEKVLTDPFSENLLAKKNRNVINFNENINLSDYDKLHQTGQNFSLLEIFTPLPINTISTTLTPNKTEHTLENFRSIELEKFNNITHLLNIYNTLLTRLVLEDKCAAAFIRLNDCCIFEYFQFLFNLYNSKAFDCFRGKVFDRSYPREFKINPLIVDYFSSQDSSGTRTNHGWRVPVDKINLKDSFKIYKQEMNFYDENGAILHKFKFRDLHAHVDHIETDTTVHTTRPLLSSLPKYSFTQKSNPIKYISKSHERLFREITYPRDSTCVLKVSENDFKKLLRDQISAESTIIANSVPEGDRKMNKLNREADKFMERYENIFRKKLGEILAPLVEGVDEADPMYLEGRAKSRFLNSNKVAVHGDEQISSDQYQTINPLQYMTPGGIKPNHDTVNYSTESKHLQLLLHLFNGNFDRMIKTISDIYVKTRWSSIIRGSGAEYQEGKGMFWSKMTGFYSLRILSNALIKERMAESWNCQDGRERGSGEEKGFENLLADRLLPYYKEHHLSKSILRSRAESLEENDYMFFAYLNDTYLDKTSLIHTHLKNILSSISQIVSEVVEPVCVKEGDLDVVDKLISDRLIEPLTNREVTDIEVYHILKKLNNHNILDDDLLFETICQNETALEKIRHIQYGQVFLAEDAPMRVPPLVRIGNNLGGYIFKMPYNRFYYDNIDRVKVDKEFDDLNIVGYQGIDQADAVDLRVFLRFFGFLLKFVYTYALE